MSYCMNKPRILFITPLPPPVHGSGMVSQYIKDCKELQDEFICDFVNLSTSRSIDEIGKSSIKKYLRFIGAYILAFWKLLTNKYSLCYLAITCHGTGFLKDAPFVLLCKLFRRKIIIHQHNKGMSKCVNKNPYSWLMPLVYRNTKVILLSWHLYQDIADVVKKEQVVICPNGIPDIIERESNIERQNEIPKLLFLSNLIPSKGVYVLLDACKILKDKSYQFTCDFIGGESKEITKDIFATAVKERNLNDTVIYHGPKYGKEKDIAFKETDIFVQPTFEDCYPLTIIEAMQYELPVLTSDEGGIPDIVQNGVNGFVCKRKDPISLANAIEKLFNDKKKMVELGKKGYEIYNKKFTLDAFYSTFTSIIRTEVSK